jgi:hypothetical protein
MKKISLILLSLAIITGCKKEETTTETVAQDTLATIETTSAVTAQDSTLIFVAQIVKNKQEALAQLKGASAEKANEIYDKLFAKDVEALSAIDTFEGSYLETAHATDDASVAKKLKALENKIQPAGLEIWDIGEGMVIVRTVADYYKNIFSGKVTPDYDRYISIVANDEKELWQADAAVSIPWKDLGERVITWENFIKEYPESKFRKDAEDTYKIYRYAFLLGLDNTQVIEITNNQMDAEARKAFTEFVKNHPDSETTTYIKMLLEDVNNKDKVAEVVRTDF